MGAKRKEESPLSRMEKQRQALEHKIKLLQRKELLALPGRVGLDSIDTLILALVEHASATTKARFKAAGLLKHATPGYANEAGTNSRVKFSTELRNVIRKELEAGEKSVAEIAREYGPSHPTIMGWKREWGMTRPRNRRAKGNGGDSGGNRAG